MNNGKVIIFSAPSGSGKSTIVNEVLKSVEGLEFSISATSREPRGTERNGVEYYFLTPEEFCNRIVNDEFVEWEEVYTGIHYGTLRSELERIWKKGNAIVFDIDVKGAVNIKKLFGEDALALFIMPPSVQELERRLIKRGTDSLSTISKRVAKAEEEIGYAEQFDKTIVNDDLALAVKQTETAILDFLK